MNNVLEALNRYKHIEIKINKRVDKGAIIAFDKIDDDYTTIENALKAFEIIKKYIDVDSFSGLTPEQKELLNEVL